MSAIDVIALDHVVLRVKDVKASLDWYKRVLGCEEERMVPDFGLYQLRVGPILIDLVPVDGVIGKIGGGAPGKKKRNMDHFAVQLLNFDEKKIRAQLKRRGVKSGDVDRRYGSLGHGPSMYVIDPDGNTVELKGPPDADQAENVPGAKYKSLKRAEAAAALARNTILAPARRRARSAAKTK